jgi:quinol monooxygenase YgiN
MNETARTTVAAGAITVPSATLATGRAVGQSVPQAQAHSSKPGPVLAVVSHPVRDYAAWRPAYDSLESTRQKAGITGAEVFHDPNDQNRLVIIHRFQTVAAAESFLADPALKTAMAKGGVTAAPTVVIATADSDRNRAEVGPVLAVISHPVADFASWRAAYAAAEPIRQKAGVTGAEVFHDPQNAKNVVIIHRFKTVSDARDFIADPDLKAAMAKGGVLAPPTSVIAVKN